MVYTRVFPRERHADLSPSRSGQIEILVPKDVQCSETYAKIIFRFFLNVFILTFLCQVSGTHFLINNFNEKLIFLQIYFKFGSANVSGDFMKIKKIPHFFSFF